MAGLREILDAEWGLAGDGHRYHRGQGVVADGQAAATRVEIAKKSRSK